MIAVSGRKSIWRGFSRVLAIKPVTLFAMHVATWVDRPLMRLTNGRLRLSFVIPVLLLRCRGARSGELREVPLMFVPDADTPLLVGSNAGRTRDPGWCYNLRHAPEISCAMDGVVRGYRAAELSGSERAEAWQRAVEFYPAYAAYARRAQREIPLFRLFPREA